MSVESSIDDLYGLPLGEFTAARNALAKRLTGDEAKRVKALAKPAVVPWAVNQLYWHARLIYQRLMTTGDALRAAQIAALEGRAGALARAAAAHKTALAEAVRGASRLAASHAARPGSDELARMLEALSLSPARPDPPGRLTELVQPAGFEALAGVTPAASDARKPDAAKGARQRGNKDDAEAKAAIEARRREAEKRVEAAERELDRARSAEADARETLKRAEEERRRAEATLAALRAGLGFRL